MNVAIPIEVLIKDKTGLVLEFFIDQNKNGILDENEEIRSYDFKYVKNEKVKLKGLEKYRKSKYY